MNKADKSVFETQASHPLQSEPWGEFREAWGNEVEYTKNGLITLHKIPFTKYKIGMFIKGPAPTSKMLSELKEIGKKKNLIFIKLEPNIAITIDSQPSQKYSKKKLIDTLKKEGAVPGKTLFTPTTFWIDLTKTEEELMEGFSSKTRYNIRLSKRKGVIVKEDNSERAFQKYLDLTFETTQRQGFYAHTPKYHQLMWKYLHTDLVKKGKKPIAHLMTAIYQKEIVTTWILFVLKDFLYYPYGASTDEYKQVMANNLMMWEAIRFGRKLGLKTFDLWGREEGKGFTKFKEGYNPEVVEFLGTWDLVIKPTSYLIFRAVEKLRWTALRLKGKLLKRNS
jgi:lipid II:glycine glycyltransferase (peptidoglycan interpeptide bridge formation enzyme)